MDEGKEKETDAVFDGNIGCEESDIANESEDEIARDNNEGQDSEDNNREPSLEEMLSSMMRDPHQDQCIMHCKKWHFENLQPFVNGKDILHLFFDINVLLN